ncbi:hypothetical protein ACJZ2D_006894 [Fusarium nematophilum]
MEAKPSGTRSRLGCLTCRRRHRKCDEAKPACKVCQKSDRECEYGSDIKWAAVAHPRSFAAAHKKNKKKKRGAPEPSKSLAANTERNRVDAPADPEQPTLDLDLPSDNSLPGPCSDPMLDMWMSSIVGNLPWDSALPGQDPGSLIDGTEAQTVEPTGDPPELEYEDPLAHPEAVTTTPRPDDWAMNHGLSPLLSASLSSPSEEIAYTYYINHASSLIPAYDGPQNPYRKLSLVSLSYPLLLHTILYVSTVSMFNYGRSNGDLIPRRRSQALSFLQQAVSFHKSESSGRSQVLPRQNRALSVLSLKEVTLAAFLMHIVTEVMSGSQATESYLQSAYQLMAELGYIESMPETFYSRFLIERFAIIDVVLSFLRRRKPIAPMSFVLYQENEEVDSSEPAFRELAGCPQVVLTFLARVSYLAHDVAAFDGDSSAEAYQLETEMRIWGQRYSCLSARDGRTTTTAYLDILSECFYWTAQLLLARRVYLDATPSPRVQFLRRHLFSLMDRLPAGCGPDSSLPFPFYMAAREAMTPEDRDWVRRKHAEMMDVYRDRAREIMMGLTEDIWTKADGAAVCPAQDLDPGLAVLENDMYIHALDAVASHCVF